MGFFDKYTNTDFHEINMDWILAKIQALKDRVKAVEDAIHDIVVETPNDGKLTIKRNNTIIGDFTANQATDEDINIVVPENTSDLNNDSDFITSSDLPDMDDYYDKSEVDDLINDINQLPDSSEAVLGTVLTHIISGDAWLPPATELPVYTPGDSGKVLTVDNNGDIEWATPAIFTQEQANWTEADPTAVSYIKNKPTLATVATSGDFNDLIEALMQKPIEEIKELYNTREIEK